MSLHDEESLTVLQTGVDLSRRQALKLLASSVAALQAACLEPPGDEVRPYARAPKELLPGRSRFFATSMVIDGLATGLVVESHEGRPTKIEGNPEHPASLGGTLPQHQASVLDLYDPDRAHGVTQAGMPSSWHALADRLVHAPRPLWIVLPPTSSPLERTLLAELVEREPSVRVVTVGAEAHARRYAGAELAFGRPLETQLDLTRASIVLALDADLLSCASMTVRWAHDFAERRRAMRRAGAPSRLYVVEPMTSATGMLADHRLSVRAADVVSVALSLSAALRERGLPLEGVPSALAQAASEHPVAQAQAPFVAALADDLMRHRGEGLIAVGERQPPVCHALAHLMNAALANLGRTTFMTAPVLAPPVAESESLEGLASALRDGSVGTLAIVDANPVHAAPPKLELAKLLRAAPLSIHIHAYRNETSAACTWHAPLSHYLESWGDARSLDGTYSVVQPLIQPLHPARSMPEVLALLGGDRRPRAHALLRESRRAAGEPDGAFEARWNQLLALGFAPESAFASVPATPVQTKALSEQLRSFTEARRAAAGAIELDIRPSPSVLDGRFANNAWLQELPHPRTKQTWGNAALLSPALARELGVGKGHVIEITRGERSVHAPVFVVPEHAPSCITLELGYGRTSRDERLARGAGANAFTLTASPFERIVFGVSARATGRHEPLACTQDFLAQHGRELAPVLTMADLSANPDRLQHLREDEPSALPEAPSSSGPQWAMTIDTTVCSGCSACVIACQSENNVPVVGKAEVQRGREMHWLRVDTYLVSEQHGALTLVNQPMMCQHCGHAPCEYVCPVFATEHSPDGLNEMTYNRCIGTRFCQANCPYKVRRFNWLHYTSGQGSLALQRNPQVTVRDRGVMEKCTYCVQRIRNAEYQARMKNREIMAGEVVTACQQACPTRAIQFGALQHASTVMVKERESKLAYAVLNHLGTRPRTMYLAKLQNPNRALKHEP